MQYLQVGDDRLKLASRLFFSYLSAKLETIQVLKTHSLCFAKFLHAG